MASLFGPSQRFCTTLGLWTLEAETLCSNSRSRQRCEQSLPVTPAHFTVSQLKSESSQVEQQQQPWDKLEWPSPSQSNGNSRVNRSGALPAKVKESKEVTKHTLAVQTEWCITRPFLSDPASAWHISDPGTAGALITHNQIYWECILYRAAADKTRKVRRQPPTSWQRCNIVAK